MDCQLPIGSLPIADCRLPIFLVLWSFEVLFSKSAIGNRQLAMIYVGTSGYSYKEWKGSFYPEKIPAKDMLSYYASRLQAVELNNTFYRLPQKSMIESWKSQVPDELSFLSESLTTDHTFQEDSKMLPMKPGSCWRGLQRSRIVWVQCYSDCRQT